jgi:hypothetical protein
MNIGVRNFDAIFFMNSFSLKSDFLYFDKLIFNQEHLDEAKIYGEWFSKSMCDSSGKLFKKNMEEIEFLEKKNMLEPYKQLTIDSSQKCHEIHTKTDFFQLMNEYIKTSRQAFELMDKFHDSTDKFDTISKVLDYTTTASDLCSITSSVALNMEGNSTIPVVQLKKNLKQHENSNHIINCIIRKFPFVDDTIIWEKIFEFKQDNEIIRKFRQLQDWIIEISKNNYSENEISQKLDFLIDEYENQIKLHQLKVRYLNLELMLSSTVGVIENLAKLNFKDIGSNLLSLKREKINLILEEQNLKGNEIAYITNVAKSFENEKDNRIKNCL